MATEGNRGPGPVHHGRGAMHVAVGVGSANVTHQ